jgi:hypothetical protein
VVYECWYTYLKGFKNVIRDHVFSTERIMLVSFLTNNTILNTFRVYAPEDCKPKEEKQNFYDNLDEQIIKMSSNHLILILWNVKVRAGNYVVQWVKQRFNEAIGNNGELLIQFCIDNNLRINSTFSERIKDKELIITCYADDAVLTADSENNLQGYCTSLCPAVRSIIWKYY